MCHSRLTFITVIIGTLLTPLGAQTHTQPHTPQTHASANPTSPVGRWVAEHPSTGGIGSWWVFRPDGTLTMHTGVVVTSPITHTATTITMPPATTTGSPSEITYHVSGDILRLDFPNTPGQSFTRIRPPPPATDQLLGKWKPVLPLTPSTDPTVAAQQKAMANALYIFSANNTESVRMPFTTSEGRWSASTHTFHLLNQPTSYSYQRTGAKLTLGQPPDSQKTDTYLPDPIH